MKNRREHQKKKTGKLFRMLFSPKLWRKITSLALAFTVFLTTYMMILPALTIDLDTAVEEPGLDVAAACDADGNLLAEDEGLQPENVGEIESGIADEFSESYDGEPEDDAVLYDGEDINGPVDLAGIINTSDDEYYGEYADSADIENPYDKTEEPQVSADVFSEESSEPVPAEEIIADDSDSEWAAGEADNYFEEEIPEIEPEEEDVFAEDTTDSQIPPEEFVETSEEETDEFLEDDDEAPFIEEQEEMEDVTEPATNFTEETGEEESEEDIEGESAPCYVLKAAGEDYHVTVSFTEEAEIPDGAVLQVEEILTEDMDYEKYVNEAAETLSTEERIMSVNNARFFDITILNGEESVEPKAPVTVLVELADGFAAEPDTAVLHYTDWETKVINTIDPAEAAAYIEEAESASAAAAATDEAESAVAGTTAEETLTAGIPEAVSGVEEVQVEGGEAGAGAQDEEGLISEDSSMLAVEEEPVSEDMLIFPEEEKSISEDTPVFPEQEEPISEDVPVFPEQEEPVSEDSFMLSEEVPSAGAVLEEEPEGFAFDETMNAIAFVADSFSVYGFVTTTLEKTILASDGHNYKMTVTFGPLTEIPEGAKLQVEEIEEGASLDGVGYEEYAARTENALRLQEKSSEYLRLFDIVIVDRDGFEIQPAAGSMVDVRMELADGVSEEVSVVHFADENDAGSFVDAEVDGQTVSFETDGFSVYAVAYTVDFHYEVDGKVYEFSIPGGGFVSLEHLVEVLGVASADESTENRAEGPKKAVENVDEIASDAQKIDYNGENSAVESENVLENGNDFEKEVLDADGIDENSSDIEASESELDSEENIGTTAYEEAININNVEVSEETKKFVADVESVEFSSPELVWVGKAEANSTIGALKEANVPKIRYSAELTEEQIAEINSSAVEAGDWVLISVQPFTSEEILTVTMKNGDRFVVKVTDAQISTHVITADGEDYIITVTYGPEAGIPSGSKLEAEEILKGTAKYESMLEQSREALKHNENDDVEILFSRFFDVTIFNPEGIKIEPKTPVLVTVQYANAIAMNDANPAIVHFAEDGIEVIKTDCRLEGDGDEGTINVFEYTQGSFSGIGTIIESDTLENGQYFIVVGDNGSYYAMKNDGSMTPVIYYHQTKQVEAPPGTNESDLLWNISSAGYGYYTFKAVNGNNYLSLQNGSVVNSSSANVLVEHNAWDETQNETGGYYLYYAPNRWDSNTWRPLKMGYWDNASHFYVGGDNSSPQRIKLYKYAMSSSSGGPPVTNTYMGIEVNPSELDEWLMSLFDDMPVGHDGYHKTAEVYDYENRIYQIDFTALSNAQGFSSDLDIAFSVDMSNSMLFPSVMTEIGTIELKQSVLESTLEKDQVYFVISDVTGTATVNALFYEYGREEWYNGRKYTVPAGWRYEDASKYARGQRKHAYNSDSEGNLDKYVENYTGFKIQGTDTGFYTLYKAEDGYLDYINSGQSVYENPYNRLADMKDSLRMAFNFLDIMAEKYHCRIRVGWNAFAKDVRDGDNYDYRCVQNNHALKDLAEVDYRTILNGITQAGNQTGGGTRPDKAFDDAQYMGWGNNTQKYLVLITDGAPQGGGASSAAAALTIGQNAGKNLTNTKGVNIVSVGLSTEHVDGAASLFEEISCMDPNPGSNQKMIYQAKDGDALKNAVTDALRIMVSKAITVGTIKDTIDPAFYPVSIDGTPLKAGDKIDLTGKLTTDITKPYGTIGWDSSNKCWTVEWKEQDFLWPDEEHPHGWHGRILVKAKENFLGGNDISTNKGQASLDVIRAKVPVKNSDGSWRFQNTSFQSLMNVTNEQLQTRYMDTPHVNIDELEMTGNDSEWTVYLDTKVDPGEQMKALFNEIKVMKVVTDGDHEMIVSQGKTSRDVMVYDLVPTETDSYSYEEAASDARDKRQVDQAFFYLKDLFGMKDSLDNNFIIDNMTAEQAIAKLLAGEKVEVKYQGYGHGTAETPVGTIILELKADPNAQVDDLDEHNAGPAGNAVEKFILSAEYKPTPESGSSDWYWNTGAFGTKDRGKQTEDKTKYNSHIINVIKRIITIQKVNSAGNPITDAGVGEAQFEIYQKDASGNTINSSTVTTSGLSYTWDYVVPDADQEVPGDYWKDATNWYLKEVSAPAGYAKYDGEIPITLNISDTKTETVSADTGNTVLSAWMQDASLSAAGNDNVTVGGDNDITIAVKNEKYGGLKILKHVTYNHEVPTSSEQKSKLAGTYTFTVYTDENCQVPYQEDGHEKTLTVTIANDGTAQNSQEISLPPGKYWIKENEPENDTYPLAEKVEVTVKEDQTGEHAAIASFTNNINEGEDEAMITVRKTFSGITVAQIPDNFKVTVTNGTDTYVLTKEPHDGNITWAETAGGLEWTWKIYGITPGTTYTVSESGETITGYDVTTTGTGSSQTISPAEMTFSIAEIYTTCSHNDWPVTDNTLFAASTTNKTGGKGTLIVTKNRLSLSERKAVEEILRPMLASSDANVWKMPVRYYSVEDNPTGFKINAGVVTYNVDDQEVVLSDTDIWQHVASVNFTKTDPTSADFNVTNTYVKKDIDISLVKVDVNHLDDTDPATLPGATFTVEKYSSLTPEEKDKEWGTNGKKTIADTGGEGTFSFEGLTVGYYKIIEDVFPAGYIKAGETPIIEVRAGETGGELEVHLLKKGEDNKYVDVTGNKDDAVKIINKTVTIGNTPGAVLPNTGGPGTDMLFFLGIMLSSFAGAGLVMKRRRKNIA